MWWASIGGERKREVLYTMPLKKNALGPSEAACIEQYKVVSKEDGGWLVTLFVTTPKVRCHLSEPVLMEDIHHQVSICTADITGERIRRQSCCHC